MSEIYRDHVVAELALTLDELDMLRGDDYSYRVLLEVITARIPPERRKGYAREPFADGRSLVDILLACGPDAARLALTSDWSARNGQIQAFGEYGRVNVRLLCSELDIPIDALAAAFAKSADTLTADPEALDIQSKAVEFLGTMNDLADHVVEKRFVRYWLKTPQKELGGSTPLQCIREGHLDLILGFAHNIAFMVPD